MKGKYQKKYWLFRNNRNPHKFIVVKRHHDRHYSFLQFMLFENGVVNYIGCRLNRHHFSRIHISTIMDMTQDYELLNSWLTM